MNLYDTCSANSIDEIVDAISHLHKNLSQHEKI